MDYLHSLSKKDLTDTLEIINEARLCQRAKEFVPCLDKLKDLILFDSVIALYAEKTELESIKKPTYIYHNLGFPDELHWRYRDNRLYQNTSVFSSVLQTSHPQHWKKFWRRDNGNKEVFQGYGYRDGWSSGNANLNDSTFSLFSFALKEEERLGKLKAYQRTATILKYISPHMGDVLKTIHHPTYRKNLVKKQYMLTPKELEVLKWINRGKTSWEISVIAARSERVIKYHIANLMRKLEATNRTHAVAIALRQGLLDCD